MKKLLHTFGFALTACCVAQAVTYNHTIYSEYSDGLIEDRPEFASPGVNGNESGSGFLTVGDWYTDAGVTTGLVSAVMPFQLPDAGTVANPFTSADLQLYLERNDLSTDVDLYHVRTAISNELLGTDYYSGTNDVSSTLIADGFITSTNSEGAYITTDTTADAALLAVLNAEYDGGAGAGSYVILRLSYASASWPVVGDSCAASSRDSGAQSQWPTLNLVDDVDQDMDGLPDSWEIANGLSPEDDGSIDEDNGPNGDPDFDGLNNSNELAQATNPQDEDTDDDGLEDGEEVNTYFTDPLDNDTDDDYVTDGYEVTNSIAVTDPNDPDSDDDGVNDATEFSCNSNPTNAASVPANDLPQIIGVDYFDYVNGTIYGLGGGEMFDIDNNISNDTYVGHTCDMSTWYDAFFGGSADVVNQGLMTSNGRQGLRAFNGINTGGMTLGVFSTDPATGSTDSNLYFKVKMTIEGSVNYAGLSFYNGGSERLFFGKTGASGYWGIDGNDISSASTAAYGPSNNVEYTIAGRFNVLGSSFIFWVDPDLGAAEDFSYTERVTAAPTNMPIYNALRLESGGLGSVRWDDLVVAYTWEGLSYDGADSDADSLRDTWELIWTNTLTALSTGNDADLDGLNDEVERDLYTNPLSSDSDGDGLDDADEINTHSTDPTDADSDDDGLNDGDEINTYSTDPNDPDSDDDTYTDGVEVAAGTDPNNPADNPGIIFIDGSKDGLYGDPVAVQTVETEFGDNASELNAAYAYVTNGNLYLLLTGNIEANGNRLEIFIDSNDDITTNELTTAGNDGSSVMDGTLFDSAFSPEFHLIAWRDGGGFSFHIADLVTSNFSGYSDIFGGAATEGATNNVGTGAGNASPIAVAFDNSNIDGVLGGTAAADTNAAIAVSTGLELCIALSDIGSPTGTVKIAAMQNGNSPHGFLSNQMLGGLVPPQGNLGGDGAGNWLGGILSGIDLNAFPGDQFFEVALPAGVAAPFGITSIQLISGNTEVELTLTDLSVGQGYKIQDSVDLTGGYTDVAGSEFTAGSNTEVIVLPIDLNTEPVRFFQGSSN